MSLDQEAQNLIDASLVPLGDDIVALKDVVSGLDARISALEDATEPHATASARR